MNSQQREEMPALLEVVAGNLVSVEEGLAALDIHRNALQKHSIAVKDEISLAVDRQLTELRAREKHLLRQVELVTTQQNSKVNVTQAQLLQHKGALSVTRTILDNCNGGEMTAANNNSYNNYNQRVECTRDVGTSVRNNIVTTVNSMPHQDVSSLLQHTEKLVKVPLVSVSIEESDLNSAIQSFGKVSLPPPMPNDLLSLEEYGDVEHHVLHKSVQPDVSSPAPIDVRKPYLLAAKNLQQRKRQENSKSKDTKKEELWKWLHRLELDGLSDSCSTLDDVCCGGEVCVEEACQANETCGSFAQCLLAGQCHKSAQEKVQQTNMWHMKQLQQASLAPACKRLSSERQGDAIKEVLNHMKNILSDDSSKWLSGDRNPAEQQNKRMKLSRWASVNCLNEFSDARSAILYQSPQSSWILPAACTIQSTETPKMSYNNYPAMPTSVPLTPIYSPVHSQKEIKSEVRDWLLSSLRSKALASPTPSAKKADYEKENSLCRENILRTKSQLSVYSDVGVENLKDKMSLVNLSNKSVSDIEEKEQWLLQQVAAAVHNSSVFSTPADNRILDEVMKDKLEWLSNSSFSIISDSESLTTANNNDKNWLM